MTQNKDKSKHHTWTWYFLIFAIISWRYVFGFIIDNLTPLGILEVNLMVLMMIIMGVIGIIFDISPMTINQPPKGV